MELLLLCCSYTPRFNCPPGFNYPKANERNHFLLLSCGSILGGCGFGRGAISFAYAPGSSQV